MIKVARVDDRLIHGQVATTWIGNNDIEVIVVVDDVLCCDPMQINILKLAGGQCKTYVQSCEKFIEKYNQHILDDYNVMLIFNNLTTPYELICKGVDIKQLTIGGLANRNGRTAYTKSVALTTSEIDIIEQIINHGVEVEYRQVYSDPKINMLEIIKKGVKS